MKQRVLLYYLGIALVLLGGGLFIIVIASVTLNLYFQKMTELALLSIFAIGAGAVLAVWFSRLGWNESLLIDFVLNQLSVVMVLGGFIGTGISLMGSGLNLSVLPFILVVWVGIVLAGLGMKYSTPSNTHKQDNPETE